MGKLGGGELNFSSDIDLIFVFPDKGTTSGARCIDNEDFFTRLGRLVIRLLGEAHRRGLACSASTCGCARSATAARWSRARRFSTTTCRRTAATGSDTRGSRRAPITGVDAYKLIHAETVRPFVYRRYLDFGVFEALREMKALIQKEVARRDLADHVKLGPGGIREIEFIVQAFQLIRGGQDRRMQTQSLLAVLPQLAGGKLLPARVAQELEAAYVFLRRLENRLQMLGDKQTHTIPADALTRERIGIAMGFADWQRLRRRARSASRARHERLPGSHVRAQ